MNPITALWTPGTLVVATVCVIQTFFVRRVVETAYPSLQAVYTNRQTAYLSHWASWWNQVVVAVLPVGTGALLGLINSGWLFPAGQPRSVRVLIGLSIGWFSTLIYKVLRKVIKEKLKLDLPDSPNPVDAPTEIPVTVDAPSHSEVMDNRHPTDPCPPLPSADPVDEIPTPTDPTPGA